MSSLPEAPASKLCRVCLVTKPVSEFSINRASRDGLTRLCKVCAAVEWREFYEKAKPVLADRQRTPQRKLWRAEHDRRMRGDSEHRAQHNAWNREYWQRHSTEIAARRRDARPAKRLQDLERHRRWRASDPSKHRANGRRYDYRERAARQLAGHHTESEWQATLPQHGHRCAWCAATEGLTRDHIIPLSKGGTDLIGNIQPLCKSCNSRKGATV